MFQIMLWRFIFAFVANDLMNNCPGAELCVHLRSLLAKSLASVRVNINNTEGGTVASGSTNRNGEYCESDLKPGLYHVEVLPTSHIAATYWNVEVPPAERRVLDLELHFRRIDGFEVSERSLIVGQFDFTAFSRRPVRICVSNRAKACEPISKWGEYRIEVPFGEADVWIELEDGRTVCRSRLKISEYRVQLVCQPK
jgi:hypothetical protein